MPFIQTAPEISFCSLRGEFVFLDLRRDRYFRVGGATAASLAQACAADLDGLSTEAADRLIATKLFLACERPCSVGPAECAAAEHSLIEEVDPLRPRWTLMPEILVDLLRVRRALRLGALPRLVAEQKQGKISAGADGGPAETAALEFVAVRRLVPVKPNCLPDSVALARFLRRRSIQADLVFGVKLQPFGAHCWVQRGRTVLNDSVGNTSDFTPILVA